jgi:hypothetical protein
MDRMLYVLWLRVQAQLSFVLTIKFEFVHAEVIKNGQYIICAVCVIKLSIVALFGTVILSIYNSIQITCMIRGIFKCVLIKYQ